MNNNDYFDVKEIELLESELRKLEKEQLDTDELLEVFGETNLRVVEYNTIPKQLFTDNVILKTQVKKIWNLFKNLE